MKLGFGSQDYQGSGVIALVDFDELGNPLGLPNGLGDLPLYQEKDGWYSVLGPWNTASDNPDTAHEATKVNLDNNIQVAIPITPLSPFRNARSSPVLSFCRYHKCSGNRLAVLHYTILYQHH